MIKRIKNIKGLGVFKDYKWDGETEDFSEVNIIYGWNYSGKTTLSRFFKMLNGSLSLARTDFCITVTGSSNKTITKDNLSDNLIPTVVFNSDYIRKNISFDDNKSCKGIMFDIGENTADVRQRIKELEEDVAKLDEWIQENHQAIDLFNEFDRTKFTAEAKKIKNDALESSIEFTKSHLKRIIDSFDPSDYQKHIIDNQDEIRVLRSKALSREIKNRLSVSIPKTSIDTIISEASEILRQEPTKVDDEPLLSNNSQYHEWVKTGLDLYSAVDAPKFCAFCGNLLDTDRIVHLNTYYSNVASKLRNRTNQLINAIEDEKQSHRQFCDAISPELFFDSSVPRLSELKSQLNQQLEICFIEYNKIITALKDKIDNNLFVSKSLPIIEQISFNNMGSVLSSINDEYNKHNKTVEDFASIKSESLEQYKLHLVAKFLKDSGYYSVKKSSDKQLKEKQEKIKERELKISEIRLKYSEIQSIVKG